MVVGDTAEYTADTDTVDYNIGLMFGIANDCNVNNLVLNGKTKVSTRSQSVVNVGSIAGLLNNSNRSEISNVTIIGVISNDNTNTASSTGTIAGTAKEATISNSNITAYIDAVENVGSVVGKG